MIKPFQILLPFVALVLLVCGCSNDNPTSAAGPAAPSKIGAVSVNENTVRLNWEKLQTRGVTSYVLYWTGDVRGDRDSVDTVASTLYTVTGLRSDQSYTFTVIGRLENGERISASTKWAGARRFVMQDSVTSIRIYEQGSTMGSGLMLDVELGGPKNVHTGESKPGLVQLAMHVNDDLVTIGPPHAFPEYRDLNNNTKYDRNTFISTTTNPVPSLDAWYSNLPIESIIASDALGNLVAFRFVNSTTTSSQGFYVRTGAVGNYHYGRVLVKLGSNGRILQTDYFGRYVELEISYQTTLNLPFA